MKFIIGLAGKKGSGKTYIANIISKYYGAKVINFADAIKQSLKCIFDFTEEELNGNNKEIKNKYWNITPREILQFYGTDLMRNEFSKHYPEIGENLWIKVVENKIKKYKFNNFFVIADVRFKNECEFIKKNNGIIINVVREDLNDKVFNEHRSENELNNYSFDYVFENNKGFKTEIEVKKLIDKIFEDKEKFLFIE